MFSTDYLVRTWSDFKEMITFPVRWGGKEWAIAGAVVGASVSAFAIDGNVRSYYQKDKHRNKFQDKLTANFTHFGDYRYELPLLASLWFLGTVFDYTPAKKAAADGAEASLFSAGFVTPIITRISGRPLPNANEPTMKFDPFVPNRYAYPSGHTTEAFAIAAVLDYNFRPVFGYWHTPVCYGMAVAVGVSRVYDHKHFVSDVILGAGIGFSIGRWISLKRMHKGKPVIETRLMLERPGVVLAYRF